MTKTIGSIMEALRASVNDELYADVDAIIHDGFRTMETLRETIAVARETQTQLQDTVTALEAENQRLREALRQIHNDAPKQEPTTLTLDCLPQAWLLWFAGHVAAKALQGIE